MRFTVRSLGGKLVISAALMLLLCMLLFSVTSWYVLKSFYEHEAISTAHTERAILIMIALAVFIITLGVTGYALVVRTFFVRPIRQLQGKVVALVADNGDTELAASTIDELSMLSRSFSLLSESLSTRKMKAMLLPGR